MGAAVIQSFVLSCTKPASFGALQTWLEPLLLSALIRRGIEAEKLQIHLNGFFSRFLAWKVWVQESVLSLGYSRQGSF